MFFKYNWPWMVWALIILTLLGIPGSDLPDSIFAIKFIDKIGHAGLFAILTILLIFGLKKQYSYRFLRSYFIVAVSGIAFLWAIITEILQLKVFSERSFEIADILADSIGIGIGFAIYLLIINKIVYFKVL